MDEPIGNPVALLIERAVYLAIGIFFIAAVLTSVLRNKEEIERD